MLKDRKSRLLFVIACCASIFGYGSYLLTLLYNLIVASEGAGRSVIFGWVPNYLGLMFSGELIPMVLNTVIVIVVFAATIFLPFFLARFAYRWVSQGA